MQYVLGVASAIHLLHGMVYLFLSPTGKFKIDLLVHVNLRVYLNMDLNGFGKKNPNTSNIHWKSDRKIIIIKN